MIFKTLFKKKKWLSEKVSDRLAAVAELELSDSGNKAVFHELAFNDGDDKVRRATLDKLNDFSLWWQAYKNDSSHAIQRYAEKVIVEALSGERECKLDNKLKQQFIQQCNKSALLEKVVFKLDDEALTLDVIERLNKTPIIVSGILNDALPLSLRMALIERLTDDNQLRKVQKRLHGELLETVELKLQTITDKKERPVRIEKQARLLLAQFNSLKDKQDFQLIVSKREELAEQWGETSKEFDALSNEVEKELTEKFSQIQSQLERVTAPLKQAYEQQTQKQQLLAQQQENAADIKRALLEIESSITEAIAARSELNHDEVAGKVDNVLTACADKSLTKEDGDCLKDKAHKVLERASQVPLIKQCIVNAEHILQQLEALSIPQNIEGYNLVADQYYHLKRTWSENTKGVDIALPQATLQGFESLDRQWLDVVKPLEKEQNQLFSQFKRKLSELQSLIEQGRYNNAFGLYKKLGFWHKELNPKQSSMVENKWLLAQEQMNSLRELQQSISGPKQQEILADIKRLAEHPLSDPTEQAHRVRVLRSNWQSLGLFGEENDEANAQFDQFSEAAFAPCREHYKALEDERADNLKAKNQIIENLTMLWTNLQSAEVTDWREVESAFLKMTKLWREIGHVDREVLDELNNNYQSVTKSIRNAINDHHKINEQGKRALLDEAEQVASSELSVEEKIVKLKELQQKWQKVGFAGRNQDQKLWKAFRTINNPIFEQRDEQRNAASEAEKLKVDTVSKELDLLDSQIQSATDVAGVKQVTDELVQVFEPLSGMSRGAFDKLKKRQSKLQKMADEKVSEFRKVKERQVFVDLFNVIENLIAGDAADLSTLKPAWTSALNNSGQFDREKVTLQLEIQQGVENSSQDKALRNQVQMEMLTAKMEQGVEFHKNELLENWLAAGPFAEQDRALLERLKKLF